MLSRSDLLLEIQKLSELPGMDTDRIIEQVHDVKDDTTALYNIYNRLMLEANIDDEEID